MDLHFGRKFLVLGFVVALVAGLGTAASAIEIQDYPEIRLVYKKSRGQSWNSWPAMMISIGDTIEVRVMATPPESVDYVIANLCAYGGGTHDTLYHFQGHGRLDIRHGLDTFLQRRREHGDHDRLTLWGLRNPRSWTRPGGSGGMPATAPGMPGQPERNAHGPREDESLYYG